MSVNVGIILIQY